MAPRWALALLVLTLTPAAVLAQAPPRSAVARVERLPDSLVATLVTPRLGANERLEPPVFVGPFGPAARTVLAITCERCNTPPILGRPPDFQGLALVDSAGAWRTIRLPPLQNGAHLPDELLAVLFENVDADPALEIVVIASYITGVGPNGAAPIADNSVLDWDGRAFVHLPDLERRIATLETAAAVRRALRGPPRD